LKLARPYKNLRWSRLFSWIANNMIRRNITIQTYLLWQRLLAKWKASKNWVWTSVNFIAKTIRT